MSAVGSDIYLLGGRHGAGQLFRYTTILMEWTMPDAEVVTGPSPSARTKHSMAAVGSDIYLFGGTTDTIAAGLFEGDPAFFCGELLRYSTISKQFTLLDAAAGVTGTVPSARISCAMAAIGTDIYLFGGKTGLGMGCSWWMGQGQMEGRVGWHCIMGGL
jgi:hypothetical protein